VVIPGDGVRLRAALHVGSPQPISWDPVVASQAKLKRAHTPASDVPCSSAGPPGPVVNRVGHLPHRALAGVGASAVAAAVSTWSRASPESPPTGGGPTGVAPRAAPAASPRSPSCTPRLRPPAWNSPNLTLDWAAVGRAVGTSVGAGCGRLWRSRDRDSAAVRARVRDACISLGRRSDGGRYERCRWAVVGGPGRSPSHRKLGARFGSPVGGGVISWVEFDGGGGRVGAGAPWSR